jgi:hypothetical protein
LKVLLILISWIQSGPVVQVQPLESAGACQVAAAATARMISAQALTNMTSPHRELTLEKEEKTGDWILLTGAIGREVARISCIRHE